MKTSVPSVLERIIESITRYSMFTRGARIGVAVSGGADSMALLTLLADLRKDWDLNLSVFHVNHGLRGEESDADERFTAAAAEALGLPFRRRRLDLRPRHGNLEERARNARNAWFAGLIRAGVIDRVATGHTKDDQAETLLFRILRGAGPRGLAGILPVTKEGVVRPLLETTRLELREFLQSRRIQWREDSSNRDLSFARNRIRYELLPLLAREWNPGIGEALARLATLSAEDEEYLQEQSRFWLGKSSRSEPDGAMILDCERLAGLPRAIARRIVRHALEAVRGHLRQIDFGHVEAILALAARQKGTGAVHLPGAVARRSLRWLRLAPVLDRTPAFRARVTPPCRLRLPGGTDEITLDLIRLKDCDLSLAQPASGSGYNTSRFDLDWDRLAGSPLELRTFRSGDRYQPAGTSGVVKIKHLFYKAGVPVWLRSSWPVLASGGGIVWAKRFGPAAGFERGVGTRNILRVDLRETGTCPESGNRSEPSKM